MRTRIRRTTGHVLGWTVFAGILAFRLAYPDAAHAALRLEPEILWTGALSRPSAHTPQWIGYAFLEQHKRRLGIRNPRQDMVITQISELPDQGVRIDYQRHLFRTPVWGDGLTIEIDREGVVRRAAGTMHADLERQLFHRPKTPALSAGKAAETAGIWLRSNGISAVPGETLLYYLPDRPGVPLVYAVKFGDGGFVLVHALTGRVIRAGI